MSNHFELVGSFNGSFHPVTITAKFLPQTDVRNAQVLTWSYLIDRANRRVAFDFLIQAENQPGPTLRVIIGKGLAHQVTVDDNTRVAFIAVENGGQRQEISASFDPTGYTHFNAAIDGCASDGLIDAKVLKKKSQKTIADEAIGMKIEKKRFRASGTWAPPVELPQESSQSKSEKASSSRMTKSEPQGAPTPVELVEPPQTASEKATSATIQTSELQGAPNPKSEMYFPGPVHGGTWIPEKK